MNIKFRIGAQLAVQKLGSEKVSASDAPLVRKRGLCQLGLGEKPILRCLDVGRIRPSAPVGGIGIRALSAAGIQKLALSDLYGKQPKGLAV